MNSYEVETTKPQAGRVNSFVEVESEAEAIAAFRKNFRLDKYEKDRGVKLKIKVACIKEDLVPAAAAVTDDDAAKVMAELRADKAVEKKETARVAAEATEATEAAEATETRPAAPFEELKPFGVGDRLIAALKAAGLSTVDEVVAYARKHGGLNGVMGIGPADGTQIAAAIKAVKTTAK